MMTMCSTSAIVPVREFAGMESARLMLAGKAAETALLMSSWRNVRRSVVMDQSVYLTSVPLARRKRYIFQKLWKKLESPCALMQDQLAEMTPELIGGALSRCRWSDPAPNCGSSGPDRREVDHERSASKTAATN